MVKENEHNIILCGKPNLKDTNSKLISAKDFLNIRCKCCSNELKIMLHKSGFGLDKLVTEAYILCDNCLSDALGINEILSNLSNIHKNKTETKSETLSLWGKILKTLMRW